MGCAPGARRFSPHILCRPNPRKTAAVLLFAMHLRPDFSYTKHAAAKDFSQFFFATSGNATSRYPGTYFRHDAGATRQ